MIQAIQRAKAHFNQVPANFPTGATTGAGVIGNGDVLAAMGGPPESLTLRLSKVDFWQASEKPGLPGGPTGGARLIGALTLNAPALEGASYFLEQSIHDATLRGRFEKGNAALCVTAWTPRGENVLVVELHADGAEAFTVRPTFEIQDGRESVTESGRTGPIAWHERRFEQPGLQWPCAVTVAMRAADIEPIRLEPGAKHTLVLALATNFDAADGSLAALAEPGNLPAPGDVVAAEPQTTAPGELSGNADHRGRAVAMATAMDQARLAQAHDRHLAWWADLWDRCAKVEIGDAYLEDRYYGSHYILASCCGNPSFPPGLFGWITNDWPGWGSDYHANYNFEAPWWGVLTSNLVDLADPYDQPILDYLPRMKAYAKRFLNVRGAYCNVGFGPKGLHVDIAATPYDDGLNFLGQKSNASFLAVNMIMRYGLTLDLDYAKRIYPYLVEVMNFWEDYLTFEDGRYVDRNDCVNECCFFMMLPPDSLEFERAKDANSPLSLGLIRLTARAAIEISEALGVDEPRRAKWRHILDHISEFPLTERDGKTMFDVAENGLTRMEDVNMCGIQHIYPGNAVSLSSAPALVRAGVDTIVYKDLWENGNSFSTIFAAAARVGVDPDMILSQMTRVTQKYIQANFLFNFGGGGIENSSGIPAGLNEMLLQSHEGFLRLFPCWPVGRAAKFEGLRAYGAFLVSAERTGEGVQAVRIVSEKGQTCTVLNPWPGQAVRVRRPGGQEQTVSGERFTLPTSPGERIELALCPG